MDGSALRRARAESRVQDRAIFVNQAMLGGAAILGVVLILFSGMPADASLLISGTALVFVTTGVVFAVPWKHFPHWLSVSLAAVDIVAVAFLHQASPMASFEYLWAFPAMWLSTAFGFAGLVSGVISITLLYWTLLIVAPVKGMVLTGAILIPVIIAGLAAISFFGARQTVAQRVVLDKQSSYLQRSVDRARRQEDLVTDVLDAVDFGVIRLTGSGALVVTNDAHARLQRLKSKDTETYGADGVTPMDLDDLPLARARRGELFENELVWYGNPGDERRRALRSTARRITDTDMSDTGTIIVTRDVTTEELALRSREDLVASVSHELRTPLTAITGYVDLVLDDPNLSDDSRRSLEVAERNAGRLLELVSDILSASASSRKGTELSIDPIQSDLAPVVEAAIESSVPRAVERHMTFDDSGIEEAPAFADPHRMRQVVDNLISNAVKYGNDGGRIEVGATCDGLHTWIVVRDDGPGIASSEVPRLFDRFFRSDSVRNTTTHGSGLGLAISRDIVRAHGGEITVQTELGKGTAFIVRLPASDPREGI